MMILLPSTHTDHEGRAFTLREYVQKDRVSLLRMYDVFEPKRVAQGLPPDAPALRLRWVDTVLAAGEHIMVDIEGRVLGHGMLLPFGDGDAELANFLHQSVRDRGIGTTLNRALLDTGRRRGIRRVWLSVEPSNRRAVRSYEKVGFSRRFTSGWAPELEMEVLLAPDHTP